MWPTGGQTPRPLRTDHPAHVTQRATPANATCGCRANGSRRSPPGGSGGGSGPSQPAPPINPANPADPAPGPEALEDPPYPEGDSGPLEQPTSPSAGYTLGYRQEHRQ